MNDASNGALSTAAQIHHTDVVTVAVIAGGIFGYYMWDLRQEEQETQT